MVSVVVSFAHCVPDIPIIWNSKGRRTHFSVVSMYTATARAVGHLPSRLHHSGDLSFIIYPCYFNHGSTLLFKCPVRKRDKWKTIFIQSLINATGSVYLLQYSLDSLQVVLPDMLKDRHRQSCSNCCTPIDKTHTIQE